VKIGIKVKLALILDAIVPDGFAVGSGPDIPSEGLSDLMSDGSTITGVRQQPKIPLMQKDGLAMNLLIQNILKNPGITDAYILNHDLMIEATRTSWRSGKTTTGEDILSDGPAVIAESQGPSPSSRP
jgi:hypothetical protein